MEEHRLICLEERIKLVAEDMGEIKSALKDIASSLNSLAILEEKHKNTTEALQRVFKSIDKHSDRLDDIEKALPYLKLASSWLFKGVIFIMGVLGLTILSIVLKGGIR